MRPNRAAAVDRIDDFRQGTRREESIGMEKKQDAPARPDGDGYSIDCNRGTNRQ